MFKDLVLLKAYLTLTLNDFFVIFRRNQHGEIIEIKMGALQN